MLSRYVASQVKHNGYFLLGLAVGLYVALMCIPLDDGAAETIVECGTDPTISTAPTDDYEPQRTEGRGQGALPVAAPARSVQRPRYYSTELGIRERLFVGVLSSEEALSGRAATLNRTVAHLLPALKFFVTASAARRASLPNVVGFTDTREMLKPFHILKYIADNYLDEYDFFFLVGDTAFVNARRLLRLVQGLGVSHDLYMGIKDRDSPYCSLEQGILLSNGVLRSVHGALDWCVRNAYSPHHHENLGRCIQHTMQLSCIDVMQGERFVSELVENGVPFSESLADAITAYPIVSNEHAHAMHAYVSRVYLERNVCAVRELRAALTRLVSHHPPAYRNATWPGGIRNDPGLAPPAPDSRFDHLRWTRFNDTYAFMPDEHRAAAPLPPNHVHALRAVLGASWAWLGARFPHLTPAGLVEGARHWAPAYALTYRLLLRLARPDGVLELRQLEIVKPLGRARLLALPYVTESARIAMLVPVLRWSRADLADALGFLQHYETTCLGRDHKTSLLLALASADDVTVDPAASASADDLRNAFASVAKRHRDARLELVDVPLPADAETRRALGEWDMEALRTRSTRDAMARLPRDALVLVLPPHVDYNEDFLNRVRMNTIAGVQAFAPIPFARYAQYEHPQFVDAAGNKPTVNTGRFHAADTRLLAFYGRDYDTASSLFGDGETDTLSALVKSSVHVLRAPEPGLVVRPRPAPCPRTPGPAPSACLHRLRRAAFADLNLGARHTLAKLLLETEDTRAHA